MKNYTTYLIMIGLSISMLLSIYIMVGIAILAGCEDDTLCIVGVASYLFPDELLTSVGKLLGFPSNIPITSPAAELFCDPTSYELLCRGTHVFS